MATNPERKTGSVYASLELVIDARGRSMIVPALLSS